MKFSGFVKYVQRTASLSTLFIFVTLSSASGSAISDQYDANQLQRLFTTDKVRTQLDRLRFNTLNPNSPIASDTPSLDQTVVIKNYDVLLQGIMLREDNKNVAWVNSKNTLKNQIIDEGILVNPKRYDPQQRSAEIISNETVLQLKPGQVWMHDQSILQEAYQPVHD